MTPIHMAILLATGLATGFVSGLLGIGGGIIMTPAQYLVYSSMGIPSDTAIKLTFGTTLLVVLPTAISGAWRHHRQRAIPKKTALIMGSFSLVSAFGGAAIAAHLPGAVLKTAFGVVLLASVGRMLASTPATAEKQPKDAPWLWATWAVVIGVISGILGVGGGILLIPVLVAVLGFSMHHAVALSLAVVIFISVGGGLGYIVNGLSVATLPAYSIGFVYLPAWFLLTVTSISTAQLGALAAYRMPAKYLRYIFTAVLLYFGLKMAGLFELLGLPL